jgi:UDP-N-acetylglucosamine diphosphorylase/glucosamine-1-phosphate N-acetyltransferase
MDKIIFTEEFCQPENLHPFTLTRQIQDIRVGILTIREKWEYLLDLPSFDKKEDDYKDLDRSINLADALADGDCYMIHGNVLPSASLVKAIKKLRNGEFVSVNGNNNIAFRISRNELEGGHKIRVNKSVQLKEEVHTIRYPWDITLRNEQAIRDDFALLSAKRKSRALSKSNRVIKPGQVFLEKGARVENCVLNASTGPIYIGKNAEMLDGCLVRGPFALGEGALLKMGTRVYGATTIGPYCVGGGEIKNSVLFGFSNKAHDGYLGDSIIGEWCNLGAGTSNSNLKNNAGEVGVWTQHGEIKAGQKCGVMMGDYSRTAINTSINTGTVVGVACNVFGNGLTPKYIPSFSWGSEGIARYQFDKALDDIANWKALKGKTLTDNEKSILQYIFDHF